MYHMWTQPHCNRINCILLLESYTICMNADAADRSSSFVWCMKCIGGGDAKLRPRRVVGPPRQTPAFFEANNIEQSGCTIVLCVCFCVYWQKKVKCASKNVLCCVQLCNWCNVVCNIAMCVNLGSRTKTICIYAAVVYSQPNLYSVTGVIIVYHCFVGNWCLL